MGLGPLAPGQEGAPEGRSGQIEGHAERTVELGQLFDRERSDIVVRSDLRRLTRLSHMIQLSCFIPSSGPIAICVDRPSPVVKTGAQITVEKRESIRAWRLTTTKVLKCFGSPPGFDTR
jgi:hypothetical protein